MKNTFSLEIAATPERVFSLLNDSESLKQWVPNLIENETVTETEERVGSTFHQVYLENGRRMEMDGRVTGFEQDNYLACEIKGKAFDLIVDYSLQELNGRTKLTQNSEVKFNSLPLRILSTVMKPFIRKTSEKQMAAQFGKLKELAENGQ